jgi:dGTPase
MAPREDEPVYHRQRVVLVDLVEAIYGSAEAALEPTFLEDWRRAADDGARLRVVIDQVASLTDARAVHWHRSLALL